MKYIVAEKQVLIPLSAWFFHFLVLNFYLVYWGSLFPRHSMKYLIQNCFIYAFHLVGRWAPISMQCFIIW